MRRRTPALGAVSRVKFAVGARCYGRSHVVATRLFDPHRCASPPPVAGGADVRVGTPRRVRRACRRSLRAFAIPRSLSRLRGPSRFRPTSPPRAVGTFVDARLLRLIPLGRKPVPAAGGGPRPAFFISALPRPCFLRRIRTRAPASPVPAHPAAPRRPTIPAVATAADLFARALRKLRPQPDTAHAQAPDTAQARGERTEVAFSIQTQAIRFVSLRAATHPARRCEGAQRPRRPLARRAGSGRARGRGARLRLRAAPAPTT